MSVVASLRKAIVPIHPEGYVFIAAAALLAIARGLDLVAARLAVLGW
jgi:hypothetical protein